MKITLAVLSLLAISAAAIAAAPDAPRLTITSPEALTMKEDFGQEHAKWKFFAGRWVRRASGGRQVLAQTAETQPWAVAILEDRKFDDVDVTVQFRPFWGGRRQWRHYLPSAGWTELSPRPGQRPRE